MTKQIQREMLMALAFLLLGLSIGLSIGYENIAYAFIGATGACGFARLLPPREPATGGKE